MRINDISSPLRSVGYHTRTYFLCLRWWKSNCVICVIVLRVLYVKIADGACLWLSGSAAAKSLRDVTRLISKTAHFDRLAYTKTVPGFTTRSLLRPNGVCVEWYNSASRTLKRRHRSNQHDTYIPNRQRSWLHLILRLSRCSWCWYRPNSSLW